MSELKPCPHCGLTDRANADMEQAWCARCYEDTDCGATTVTTWNSRPIEDAIRAELEAAKAVARGRLNALLVYGRHHSDCAQPVRGLRCSCGLDSWLTEGPTENR